MPDEGFEDIFCQPAEGLKVVFDRENLNLTGTITEVRKDGWFYVEYPDETGYYYTPYQWLQWFEAIGWAEGYGD